MLSESFLEAINKYGEPDKTQHLNEPEISSLPDFFPDSLIDFYKHYGRCVFKSGVIQVCHPDDMKPVLSLIFKADKDFSHKNCYVYCYTCFGTLHFLHEKYGYGYLNLILGEIFLRNLTKGIVDISKIYNTIYVPFSLSYEDHDQDDIQNKPLFKRAKKRCGPLDIGECYGFAPILALGGAATIENVRRFKALEHFSMVAQTVDYNLISVEGYGKSRTVRPIG